MTDKRPIDPPGEPTLADPESLEARQVVQGRLRYRLEERLGQGSFGVVWRAICLDLDPGAPGNPPETVAIKFFPTPGAEEAKLLQRELAALLPLRVDRIPRVYDWLMKPGISFFVMDHYDHGGLTEVFELAGWLDDTASWRLLSDLLRALQFAHRAGILHLDIKPSNVLLDGTGGYVLLDFGISQASHVTHGPAQTVGTGSPGYQAPEQRRRQLARLDTRTDLWGVGATVWAARSGRDLNRHRELVDPDASGSGLALPPLSKVRPDCCPDLERIVMSLLRDDLEERPGGAAEVLVQVKAAEGLELTTGPAALTHAKPDPQELNEVIHSIMDPLWASIFERADLGSRVVKFEDRELLCRDGEPAHETFLLLRGRIEVEQGGEIIATEGRQGLFIGEVSTLMGTSRTASVRAVGPVWVCVFNAAQLERLLAYNPAVGIRLVKLLAERLYRKGRQEPRKD